MTPCNIERLRWKHITKLADIPALTWAKLLYPSITCTGVNGKEVFVPGDFGIWVPAGGTQHGGRSSALHHFELRAHVNVGEAWWKQVLCGSKSKSFESSSVKASVQMLQKMSQNEEKQQSLWTPSYSKPDGSFPTKVKWGLSVHMCSELLYPGRSS